MSNPGVGVSSLGGHEEQPMSVPNPFVLEDLGERFLCVCNLRSYLQRTLCQRSLAGHQPLTVYLTLSLLLLLALTFIFFFSLFFSTVPSPPNTRPPFVLNYKSDRATKWIDEPIGRERYDSTTSSSALIAHPSLYGNSLLLVAFTLLRVLQL